MECPFCYLGEIIRQPLSDELTRTVELCSLFARQNTWGEMDAYMKKPLLPRTNDFVFKKIFGENVEILADLLSCIIDDLPPDELKDIEYINAELPGDTQEDKASIMDIRAITKSKHPVNIEMQVRKHGYAGKRLQFYSARQYVRQLKKGNDYYRLRKTYTIMFADFAFDDSPHWLRRAKWCDKDTDFEVPDSNEIIVIEMPKVGIDDSPLANWVRFIKSLYEEELMQLATTNPTLHQAFQVLNELSQKDEAWDEYERREKFFLDQLTNEREAYENGVRDTEERVMREADLKIKEVMKESDIKIKEVMKESDIKIKEAMKESDIKIKEVMKESDIKIKEVMKESDIKINNLVMENEERMNKTALNLLGMNLTPEQVAKSTGLPIEKVKQLIG